VLFARLTVLLPAWRPVTVLLLTAALLDGALLPLLTHAQRVLAAVACRCIEPATGPLITASIFCAADPNLVVNFFHAGDVLDDILGQALRMPIIDHADQRDFAFPDVHVDIARVDVRMQRQTFAHILPDAFVGASPALRSPSGETTLGLLSTIHVGGCVSGEPAKTSAPAATVTRVGKTAARSAAAPLTAAAMFPIALAP